MQIHNPTAVRRNIHFIGTFDMKKNIRAAEHCCWNCNKSIMTYESLWCEREMSEVDFRDLCPSWKKLKHLTLNRSSYEFK